MTQFFLTRKSIPTITLNLFMSCHFYWKYNKLVFQLESSFDIFLKISYILATRRVTTFIELKVVIISINNSSLREENIMPKIKGQLLCLFTSVIILVSVIVINCTEKSAIAGTSQESSTKSKAFKWRMPMLFPAGSEEYIYYTEHPEGFIQLVKKLSGGRLTITPFGTGVLMPASEQFDAVSNGVVEGGIAVPAYWAGKIPACNFAYGIPYLLIGERDCMGYLTQPYGKAAIDILKKEYSKHNVHLAAAMGYIDNVIFSRKPIRTLEDFKGMKIRLVGTNGAVLEKVGASAVSIAAPEIYTSLQTGVVDAAFWGNEHAASLMKLHEVTDYIIYPPITGQVTLDIIINQKAYNALPDDLKAVVDVAANWGIATHQQQWQYKGQLMRKRLLASGDIKQVITLPEKDVEKLHEITMEVLKEYSKLDAPSAEMYKLLVDYLEMKKR